MQGLNKQGNNSECLKLKNSVQIKEQNHESMTRILLVQIKLNCSPRYLWIPQLTPLVIDFSRKHLGIYHHKFLDESTTVPHCSTRHYRDFCTILILLQSRLGCSQVQQPGRGTICYIPSTTAECSSVDAKMTLPFTNLSQCNSTTTATQEVAI